MPAPKMTDAQAAALLKTRGERPIKFRHLPGVMDAVAGVIKQYTDGAVAPLLKRIDALELEVAELKAAGAKTLADFYRGTWQPAAFDPYQRGMAVTHDGSLWLARSETRAKPGTDDSWQMITKKGRDGKDAAP